MSSLFYTLTCNHRINPCVINQIQGHDYDPVALLRGEYMPDEPIIYRHYMGRKPKDILFASDAFTKIVSQRVMSILAMHHVTGWSTYPVLVEEKNGDRLDGYLGLSIVGRCGPLDDSKSRIEIRESPYNPGYKSRYEIGLFFDIISWDGSDIFTPGGGIVIVVEKVKDIIEKARINEVIFINIQDYEVNIGPA